MLWGGHLAQTQAFGEAKRRQEEDEAVWASGNSARGVHGHFKGITLNVIPRGRWRGIHHDGVRLWIPCQRPQGMTVKREEEITLESTLFWIGCGLGAYGVILRQI